MSTFITLSMAVVCWLVGYGLFATHPQFWSMSMALLIISMALVFLDTKVNGRPEERI